MGSENANRRTRNKENGFGFNLLEQNHKHSDEFLNHIIDVTGDKSVSLVYAETREQSKQWMHIYSPNMLKKLNKNLSSCQRADETCFLGQERSADGGIHATKDHNNIRSVLQNTKKTTCGMLISSVALFHDNACMNTALKHC
jgi:hypothetical protein